MRGLHIDRELLGLHLLGFEPPGLVAQTLEMDASSGFTGAADAAGPGLAGRLLGRWLGATAMGGLLAVLVLSLSWPAAEQGPLPPIWLLSTTIVVIALAAAWTLVLGAFGGGVVGMVAGSLAWLLAFLPMGHPAFFGGAMGRALRAVLPNPPWETAPLSWWGVKLLVLVALLGVAVAGARPVTKRG